MDDGEEEEEELGVRAAGLLDAAMLDSIDDETSAVKTPLDR